MSAQASTPYGSGNVARRCRQVSVGIFAHNESGTVAEAIEAFIGQEAVWTRVTEIIVVCCSCTDGCIEIAQSYTRHDPRVRVIERKERTGKLAAINEFLEAASSGIVILSGADIIPGEELVDLLIHPMLRDERCGMTGPKVMSAVPPQHSHAARLHALLWQLHHEVARCTPKLGETVAVRRSLLPILLPAGIHCDEVLLEWLVLKQGGYLTYVAEAGVRNFPPCQLRQLYRQRRRIACQHAVARRILRYRPATNRLGNAVTALGRVAQADWRRWAALVLLCAVEIAARTHGRVDSLRGRHYSTWRPAKRDVPTRKPHLPPGRMGWADGREGGMDSMRLPRC